MHSIKKWFFLSFIIVSVQTNAADFENGIPLELMQQLTQGEIMEGLPDSFPQVDLPSSVDVFGSLDNDLMVSVILNIGSSANEAMLEVADSFMDAGWEKLASVNYEMPENGFVYANQEPNPISSDDQFCHDRFGLITLSDTSRGSAGFITVRLNNQPRYDPGFSCLQQNQQREMQRNRGGAFPFSMANRESVPRLVLPEDSPQPRNRPFFGIGGFSGSGNDIEVQSRYAGEFTSAELLSHFAEQLQAQGWQNDMEWNGEVYSGSSWTRSTNEGGNLIGILGVLDRNAPIIELKFRLVDAGQQNGGATIMQNVIRSTP